MHHIFSLAGMAGKGSGKKSTWKILKLSKFFKFEGSKKPECAAGGKLSRF